MLTAGRDGGHAFSKSIDLEIKDTRLEEDHQLVCLGGLPAWETENLSNQTEGWGVVLLG